MNPSDSHWFQSMIDSAEDAIIGTDARGIVVSWNHGAERLYGYAARDMLGRSISSLVPPDRPDQVPRLLERIYRGERVPHFEAELACRDGARIGASTTVSPVRDEAGTIVGVSFVSRDMTSRIRAILQLRQDEAKGRAIVESWMDAVITIDERGTIASVNPATEKVFGYAKGEVLGRNVSMLMPEPSASEHAGYLARYLRTGEKRVIGIGREAEGKRKDGTTFPIDVAISEVALHGRRMFAGVIRNISERKRLEEQLAQSQKMETVGRLAGGVAHDFNNLMTAVIGHATLGAMALAEDDPLRQDLEEIRATADRAAALTQQLLAFARRQMVEPRIVDLNRLILDMRRMLGRLIKEDIELVVPQEGLGRVKVDPHQFEQVVVNLVVNARDAMPRGGRLIIETANVTIDRGLASAAVDLAEGEYVMLAVTDTGAGLSEEARSHLFEPFFTTKEPGRGTGLGLATSYGIVRQAGGNIYAYSEPEAGTSMKVYLPRADGEGAQASAQGGPGPLRRGMERVLLVEDEEVVRNVAARVLRTLGYTVVEASNGVAALALIHAGGRAFDAVVADVVMPDMGGVELLGALEERGTDTRVLLTSGYTDEAIVRYGARERGAAFLQKPYTPEALASKLRELLDG